MAQVDGSGTEPIGYSPATLSIGHALLKTFHEFKSLIEEHPDLPPPITMNLNIGTGGRGIIQ